MKVVGFDFGTTNSLISIVKGNRVLSLTDDQGLPTPSVVCYEGTKTIVGREARERLSQAGLGVHGNLVRSPKSLLGHESVFVGGVEKNPVDIVKDVVHFVREQASKNRVITNIAADNAVVTIPVNMEGRRRALLRDAFRMAGISILQFVHEPLAALYGYLRSSEDFEATMRRYDRQLVLVCDWGGGTLDLTICKVIDGFLVQIGNDGTDEVGGDVFDNEIKNEVEKQTRQLRDLSEDVAVQSGSDSRLMHACERAKIDLSKRSWVNIYVPNFFRGLDDPDLDLPLSRDKLNKIVGHLFDKGLSRIERLLAREGYSTSSVSMCLATGGMANIPAIKSRLHELFGPQRVHSSERSASLISEGAAWVAHDKAKLHLAKNVELVLARNSYMPLLNAGLEMPQEGQVSGDKFSLYCVDPTDGFGKFQFMSPHRPGPNVLPEDIRRTLANIIIQVDKKAEPFFERLQLNITIDENLVLKAHAKSLNKDSSANTEIHDLEFMLALPTADRGSLGNKPLDNSDETRPRQDPCSLTMRSNIAETNNDLLVPGEVLYRFNPRYFDARRNPPKIQVNEHLYYTPCSRCSRKSNDPECTCR